MLKVYGIKTCGSVRKALSFFKEHNIEVDFFDFKKDTPETSRVKNWVEKTDINTVLNNKGTKYKTLKLKELNLDDTGKFEWVCKEPMLIKRPVIENNEDITIGFDEELYKSKFL